MRRARLISRAAKSIGYDPARKILEVEFTGGGVYQYYGVGPEVVMGLVRSPSRGRFINKEVVGCFKCRRVGGPEKPGACAPEVLRRGGLDGRVHEKDAA